MKNLILFICFLVFSGGQLIQAQQITGKVLDENGKPMPFTTLQLLKADSSIQKIETSKTDGSFSFSNLKTEKYFLGITFVGYAPLRRTVDLQNGNGDLGNLQMKLQSTELKAVTIAAEKPMVEIEPDKTVFNVSKSLSTTGEDGLELLRKAPGLQIDNNENIVLEGKSGVNVYINGKQSYLSGTDLTNFLKGLRAEDIEKVEIITQPSSKYDAAGSAGILNIILKREKGLGTKGTVSHTLTYGDYARNNSSLSVNNRNKKYALFGNYSHYEGQSTRFFNLKRQQGTNIFDGKTTNRIDGQNDRIGLGGEYYLTKNATMGAAFSANHSTNTVITDSKTPISQSDDFIVDSILTAPNRNAMEVDNYTANLNYTFKDTSGRQFSVDLDFVSYENASNSYQPNFYVSPNEEEVYSQTINYQETPVDILVYSAKTDYEQKLGSGIAAVGAKVSQVSTHNVFDFYGYQNGDRILNLNRSNVFDYEESILAAYLNYQISHKKWKFQGGLRAEQTYSEGDLKSNTVQANKNVKREYLNLFPSGGITYEIKRGNSLALIYSRRIQRPNYQNLNPFESQINELSFRKGNPFLQPQFTDNLKLSHTYRYKLNTSFTYSYISDYFAEVTEAEGDRKSFINTRNVADQAVYNFSVSYPLKITKWWNVYASTYLFYTEYTANNPAFIPIDQTVYGGYGQSSFSLPRNFKAEVSGWYSSPSIWRGTYRTKSIGALNLALQKSWGNWTAKVSYNDILYTIPWRAETRFGNLAINGTGGADSRNISFFLSYAFGQSDVKESRRRESGAEDEQNRIQ